MLQRKVFVILMSFMFIFCLNNLAHTKNHTKEQMKILTNHLGYELNGPKHAVIQGYQGDSVKGFCVYQYDNDQLMFEGKAIYCGGVDHWKNWIFWTIQFDPVKGEGVYFIECDTGSGKIKSFPFKIQKDLLISHTLSDVIYYFKSQRSDGQKDKADRHLNLKGFEGITVDAHGGWYDATGDYGKHLSQLSFASYFNTQQTQLVIYSCLKTYEVLDRKGDRNFRQFKRRLLDEALHGADFLVRMKRPNGSFYESVSCPGFEKRPEDRIITPTMKEFKIKETQTDGDSRLREKTVETDVRMYEAGFRDGAGISIAALAMAARLDICGDFSTGQYLKTAEDAFAYLEKNNLSYANDGKENIVDDYCILAAATELYKTTQKQVYLDSAIQRANNLMARLCSWKNYQDYFRADDKDRPFFHPSDAGYPVVSLLYFHDIAPAGLKPKIIETVRRAMTFELNVTAEATNPFGYARQLVQSKDGSRRSAYFFPHDTETQEWWQGENARLGSLASAARIAIPYFKENPDFQAKLKIYAQDQLNWILGMNPFNSCMLHGTGRNNPWYMFFNYYEYFNCPGGIVNGITGGLDDPNDIDFNLLYSETGKDNDWRWGEQWLPHSSWYLLAIALGE